MKPKRKKAVLATAALASLVGAQSARADEPLVGPDFTTLTIRDQRPRAISCAKPEPDFEVGDRNAAVEFERFRARLKIGCYF